MLLIPGFKEEVFKNITETFLTNKYYTAIDMWQTMMSKLRQFLRGYGANVRGEYGRRKKELLDNIKAFDVRAENKVVKARDWERRYDLEKELVKLYKMEELYWQRRGGVKWILEGDANTGYFQSIANGRRRKCMIEVLETETGRITEQEELIKHIYTFYQDLFGSEERGRIRMADNVWREKGALSQDQRERIIRPFTIEEVEFAL